MKVFTLTFWAFIAFFSAILLHSPRALEFVFAHKKWQLTHVLQNDEFSDFQIQNLLKRTPAPDVIEQIMLLSDKFKNSEVLLQRLGYRILKSSFSAKEQKILPRSAFFIVTSFSGQPIYTGRYQGLNQELEVLRSFYGRSRQNFYNGFSCGENIKIQSLLNHHP